MPLNCILRRGSDEGVGVQAEHDVVVFDEDAASYVSATDYRQMLHSIAPELGQEAEALHSSHRRLQVIRFLSGTGSKQGVPHPSRP